MWALVEELGFLLVVVIAITQFFIPLILDKPLFSFFRPKVKKELEKEPIVEKKEEPLEKKCDLKSKVAEAKSKVAEVKKVQSEVTDFHKSAEELKKESDDMLK